MKLLGIHLDSNLRQLTYSFSIYIHLYSHKLQLQKQEIKKTKEKHTHNVSKNTTYQIHTNYAQRKRKIDIENR